MTARRPYELKERARRQEETRQRIIDATVALHREVGPARTTVTEIARRAGVGRVTVYNHFPDERELLGACSAQFVASSPPPDIGAWAAIADPAGRLRHALEELYAYYRANADMLANVQRDIPLLPALAEVMAASGEGEYRRAQHDILAAGLPRRARPVIALVLSFPTWQTLTQGEELGDRAAAELGVRLVEAVTS